MAEIYRAKTFDANGQPHLVAVKRVLAHLAEDDDFIQMLVDEAKIASVLRHSSIARVYEFARAIPRGETRTYAEVAAGLRMAGALHSVTQALAKNPFMIIVPCHRVLETGNYPDKISPNGGTISKRRLLSVEGTHQPMGQTLFDVLLPSAPPRLPG